MLSTTSNPVNPLCTGCGLCVSEAGGALKMRGNEFGFLVPSAQGASVPASAVRVCPFNPAPADDVRDEDALGALCFPDADYMADKAGRFIGSYVGYSRQYRESSSSGGIATFVFSALLEKRHVDHLFVVVEGGEAGYEYRLISQPEDIRQISKTRYVPVTLEKLFELIEGVDGRVAVSAVACFAKAIRLKQHYHVELKEKIPFVVGIICGGWKSRFFTEFLAQSAGIEGAYASQEYRIKDPDSTSSDYSFGAYAEDGAFHETKMRPLGDMWGTGLFKAEACDFCTDVLTELADISLGDAWLPEYRADGLGNSVIVTRTGLAERIVRDGMNSGDLVLDQVPVETIVASQSASFSHRHNGLKFRVDKMHPRLRHPAVRRRVMQSISWSYALVQWQREVTRSRSLSIWRDSPDVSVFNARMRRPLAVLRFLTRVYHKLRPHSSKPVGDK